MLEMYLECHIHIKCEYSALCSRFVSIGHQHSKYVVYWFLAAAVEHDCRGNMDKIGNYDGQLHFTISHVS